MNIAIAGYGFVGKAIEAYLHKTEHTTQIIDPKYSNMSVLDTKCAVSYTHLTLPTKRIV